MNRNKQVFIANDCNSTKEDLLGNIKITHQPISNLYSIFIDDGGDGAMIELNKKQIQELIIELKKSIKKAM